MSAADNIRVDYDGLNQAAQVFSQESEAVQQALQRLDQQVSVLAGGCWVGPAADEFYSSMGKDVFPALKRLVAAMNQAHDATHEMARIFADAEQNAADQMNGWGDAGGAGGPGGTNPTQGGQPGAGRNPTQGGQPGAGSNPVQGGQPNAPWEKPNIRSGSHPNTLYDTQTEILRRHLGGELTADQARDLMATVASKDQTWGNAIDAKGQIWSGSAGGDAALGRWDSNLGGYGQGYFALGQAEAKASGGITVGTDGTFDANGKAEIGLYAARLNGTAEYNGMRASVDGIVGARASAGGNVTFNPTNGKVGVGGNAEAFAGATIGGTVGYGNDFFGVDLQGNVGYGAGAKAGFKWGYDNGKVTLQTGATVGVGVAGGGGVNVTLDIPRAGGWLLDQGRAGAQALYDSLF